MSIAVLASTVAEEHVVNELPLAPHWFAILFMVGFIALALICHSYSGRGVVRPDSAPSELSEVEWESVEKYDAEYHRH